MKQVTCRCEAIVEIDAPECIDLDIGETLSKLADGDSPSAICPRCGALVRAELPIRVSSASRRVDIVVLSEMERLSVYRGKIDAPGSSEVLLGYQELFERARILKHGLEPKAVEALKYYLQGKAEESEPEADVTVLYNGVKGEGLEFHILGLKSGQTGVVCLNRASYDKMDADLASGSSKEPWKTMFSGRYKSLKKLGFIASITEAP